MVFTSKMKAMTRNGKVRKGFRREEISYKDGSKRVKYFDDRPKAVRDKAKVKELAKADKKVMKDLKKAKPDKKAKKAKKATKATKAKKVSADPETMTEVEPEDSELIE